MRETVVLVHGIWSIGVDLLLLRRRLRSRGLDVRMFRYRSLRKPPAANAEALHRYLQAVDAETVHLVAHSLGGVVVLHLFALHPNQRPGRVVMLSSPVAGSSVARRVVSWPLLGRLLAGRSTEGWLDGDAPSWNPERPLGMIAGTRGFGTGVITGALRGVHDGMVAVEETRVPGITAHVTVPYSHLGMLHSRQVAELVVRFCRTGGFENVGGC